MERQTYVLNGTNHYLLQTFLESASTDDVVVDIYNVSTSSVELAETAMTFVRVNDWKYTGWTPSATGFYIVTYLNKTMGVKFFEYIQVVGTLTGVPGGAGTGSTQATLRTKFLKLIDNYNAADLSGTNSSGEVADLCINEGLQIIYQDIKASRYMDGYASSALVSTSGQSYIELSAISDLDELMGLQDTTNDISLQEISAWRYFSEVPSPSNVTGTPYRYCRIFNRIYLDPQPDAGITYTTPYKKTYARLASDSDVALIPSKFDGWIYAEARLWWLMMEDMNNSAALSAAMSERNRIREIALDDIGSQFNAVSVSKSHFRKSRLQGNPYNHLNPYV